MIAVHTAVCWKPTDLEVLFQKVYLSPASLEAFLQMCPEREWIQLYCTSVNISENSKFI